MTYRFLASLVLLAAVNPLFAQRSLTRFVYAGTYAGKPAAGLANQIAIITDCVDTTCSTGGGSTVRLMRDTGSAWAVLGDGDSGGSPAFSSVTAGTNTVALVIGTNGSLTVSGSGTINATSLGGTAAASYATDAEVAAAYQPLDAALTALAGGSDFVVFSGPASSSKTFTLPNASATILTTNAAVTVAQGGTGLASGTSGGILGFTASGTLASSVALTADALVAGAGAGATPVPSGCTVSGGSKNILTCAGFVGSDTSNAGYVQFGQGTASTADANTVRLIGAASIGTAWTGVLPSAIGATGVLKVSVSGATATYSHAAIADADVPDNITITLAATATALASNPTDCSANQFANAIAANGNLTCGAIADADVPDTITVSNYLPLAGGTLTGALVPLSGTAPTTNAAGQVAFDTNAWATSFGAIQVYNGTANTYLVGVEASDTPSNGQVLKWNTGGTITWEADSTGGTPSFDTITGATNTTAAMVVGAGASLRTAAGIFGVPASTSLPGTCTVGDAYMDTDATTGRRFYLCESTNTWVLQGTESAASDTVSGIVELATAAETTTGTDAARAVTPDGLAGSTIFGVKTVEVEIFPAGTAATTGDGKAYFRIPAALNGMNLISVKANVYTAGTTGTINLDIARCAAAATGNVCSGTVSDVLSTNLTIDSAENSSSTAAAAAVIDTGQDDVATDQIYRFDIDAIHTTPSQGMIVELTFQLPT